MRNVSQEKQTLQKKQKRKKEKQTLHPVLPETSGQLALPLSSGRLMDV